jgi:Plasmid recombination enzyme.
MGYISLQFTKVKGTSDTRMSDHIERKTIPSNADPTRTHLNRELIGEANEVRNRDHAITERIQSAGIKRKITPNQVRAIRIMLSGTHEDMMQVQQSGRLNEWCNDNLQWLYKEFGRENTVSAVLHMDEHTPHIHATVIPIVKGERRKASQEKQDGKKKYRKKSTDTARLCADDVLTRDKMIAYHNSYSAIMEKYGLRRGERGSEARHVTTAQYYRNIQREKKEIEAEVQQLRQEKQETQVELVQAKREIKIDKLKGKATDAATNIAESVGSLFGSNKFKALEQGNRQLYQEVVARDESIENLQTNLQRIQEKHRTELLNIQAEHHKEVLRLNRIIQKAFTWIPLLKELFRMEKMCRLIGFTAEQTATLVVGTPLEYSGKLHSEEYRQSFTVSHAVVQIGTEQNDKSRLFLSVNRINVSDWFKEQFNKCNQSVQVKQELKKGRGIKM